MRRLIRAVRRIRRDVRLLLATLRLRFRHTADVERWSDERELNPEWEERAKVMARYVPPHSRVIDFGAGRRSLERFLDPACLYIPADLVSRGSDTVLIDVNRRPLPDLTHLGADVGFFAGLLEYVDDLPSFVAWVGKQVPYCVISYQLARSRRGTAGRWKEAFDRAVAGWVNTYNRDELKQIFEAAGYRCELETVEETPFGPESILLFRRSGAV